MTHPAVTTGPLALLGGTKVRTKKFPAYLTVGEEEKKAVTRVIDSGILSRFLGAWHQDFNGGPEVQAFECEWAAYFGVKHAISVNSATSALYAAVGAAGVEPGDEVIVSPYTMSASAVAPLVYSAIPVFADVEPEYFCLDPDSVESCITSRTKAIIVVDIFGQPYDAERINAIAKKHNLVVIEDCAQAPGATLNGKFAGTLGNIGIYSLNYHKHIHTGEGGVLVTNDDELARRLRLIRNHAESVVAGMGYDQTAEQLSNMVGFNYRMTELEAAVGREQLKKLSLLIEERRKNVAYLSDQLSDIPCLEITQARPGAVHAFYTQVFKFDSEIAGVDRSVFLKALQAELPVIELRETEGVKVTGGYVKPIYLQPMFAKKIAFGRKGHPWATYDSPVRYEQGICPVVEDLHFNTLISHELMRPPMTLGDLDDVVTAFHKVWEHRELLKNYQA